MNNLAGACFVLVLLHATVSLAALITTPAEAQPPTRSPGHGVLHSGYYYEPVAGKRIGLWPDVWSTERIAELKNECGFSGVLLRPNPSEYPNALQAGFAPSAVMMQVGHDTYTIAVDSFPSGTYYLDEPAEHTCYGNPSAGRLYQPEELATIRDYIRARRPGSRFVIGGYKRCSHNRIASTFADAIMFPSYKNWNELPLPICHIGLGWGDEYENLWIPGSEDQSDSWTDMHDVYGPKYMMTWIHGRGDEYDVLFPHANALALTELWLFNSSPIDSTQLELFCSSAWKNGWLRRISRGPLSVDLSWFAATRTTDNAVLLEWVSRSEKNNRGFEIQAKGQGGTDFFTLPGSYLQGSGTTTEQHTYLYTDSTIRTGRWLYRLVLIEINGTIHYGPEVMVDLPTRVN